MQGKGNRGKGAARAPGSCFGGWGGDLCGSRCPWNVTCRSGLLGAGRCLFRHAPAGSSGCGQGGMPARVVSLFWPRGFLTSSRETVSSCLHRRCLVWKMWPWGYRKLVRTLFKTGSQVRRRGGVWGVPLPACRKRLVGPVVRAQASQLSSISHCAGLGLPQAVCSSLPGCSFTNRSPHGNGDS